MKLSRKNNTCLLGKINTVFLMLTKTTTATKISFSNLWLFYIWQLLNRDHLVYHEEETYAVKIQLQLQLYILQNFLIMFLIFVALSIYAIFFHGFFSSQMMLSLLISMSQLLNYLNTWTNNSQKWPNEIVNYMPNSRLLFILSLWISTFYSNKRNIIKEKDIVH